MGAQVQAISEFIKAMGATRLAAMGAVALALAGFFIYLMIQLSSPQMGVLFSDLEMDDSLAIIHKLEAMNIPHQVRSEGAVILVPEERILRLRMDMAGEGLPSGGTIGYEIFDKGSSLGTTSFVQNINHLRALEGELARTIASLQKVQKARVHLVLPERKLFSRKRAKPRASIVIKSRGQLDSANIAAIQHLVASAIEDLAPGQVSIVDEKGHLLASGNDDGRAMIAARATEQTIRTEKRLRDKIRDIVASVVGEERAMVRVTAELDFRQITQTSEKFDPDGRVVRSSQTREENRSSSRKGENGGVTVGNELPDAGSNGAGNGAESDNRRKSEEIVNYEISRTTRTETMNSGRIKRLSVAVLVDGRYAPGPDGKPVYKERSQQELAKISELVKSAMGYDKSRGDQLKVVNLRFAANIPATAPASDKGGSLDLSKDDYFHLAELAALLLITLLVLIFVVRPLVRRIVTPEEPALEVDINGEKVLIGKDEDGNPVITGPDGQPLKNGELPALEDKTTKTARIIQSARINGELQASAVEEIGSIVENGPADAVAVLRQWMEESQQEAEPSPQDREAAA